MTNAKTESAVCLLAKSVSGNNKKKGEQNQAGSDDRLGEPANAINFGGALSRQLRCKAFGSRGEPHWTGKTDGEDP